MFVKPQTRLMKLQVPVDIINAARRDALQNERTLGAQIITVLRTYYKLPPPSIVEVEQEQDERLSLLEQAS